MCLMMKTLVSLDMCIYKIMFSILTRNSKLSTQFDTEEIALDCRQVRYLAAGSSNAVKLSRFYDKVIEKRFHSRAKSPYEERFNSRASTLPSKFYPLSHQD